MKRKTIFTALSFLLTLGFAGCSQEEVTQPEQGQEIRVAFTTDAIKTRVNTLDTGDEWENGDELYFCRVSKENQWAEYSLAAIVADDITTWSPSSKLYWDGKGKHSLIVNYPCNLGLGWDDFAISDDQSTLENLKKADCMNARWAGTPTTETINFNLKHRMSMVTVTYTLASEFDSNVEIVPQVYSKARYIIFSDADDLPMTTSVGQYDIWVKAYKHEELDAYENVVAKKFTAIVSPDAYSAGDDFIRIYVEGEQLIAKMKEDITFAEGTHYTFDLKVGKDKVSVEQVSMGDFDSPFGDGWNNEEDLN